MFDANIYSGDRPVKRLRLVMIQPLRVNQLFLPLLDWISFKCRRHKHEPTVHFSRQHLRLKHQLRAWS